MSSDVLTLIIGTLLGLACSLVGILANHYLTLKRDKLGLKLEAERALRKRLVEGVSPGLVDREAKKLYEMIERNELPRAYAFDPDHLADILDSKEPEE
jgi:hypothetical protein